MAELYYTPPDDSIFAELKICAIKIWQTYDNQFGYVDEKVDQIKDIENVGDNFMFIVAMFDDQNQLKLANMISDETKQAVADRLKDGGMPDQYNNFLHI